MKKYLFLSLLLLCFNPGLVNSQEVPFEGIRSVFYENGSIKEEWNFKNGLLDGPSKLFYENGQLRLELHYENGELVRALNCSTSEGKPFSGVYKYHHDNGLVRWEAKVKDGIPNGKATTYGESGEKIKEFQFQDGEVISSKIYNESGEADADT